MKWFGLASLVVAVSLPMVSRAQVTSDRWLFLFEQRCAVCHGTESLVPNAVSREAFRMFSPSGCSRR